MFSGTKAAIGAGAASAIWHPRPDPQRLTPRGNTTSPIRRARNIPKSAFPAATTLAGSDNQEVLDEILEILIAGVTSGD